MIGRIRSDFVRQVATLLTGTTIATAIPFVVAPVLTRLYTPEDFALLGIFVALTAPLAAIATGQYELAIMLPESEEDASSLLGLTCGISVLWATLILVAGWLFGDVIAATLGNPALEPWLLVLPVSVLFLALQLTFTVWSNRRQAYGRMATAAVTRQAAVAGVSAGMGAARLGPAGLIWGITVGHVAAASYLWWRVRTDAIQRAALGWSRIVRNAKRYYRFPLYTLPYSLLTGISGGVVIIGLTAFGYIVAAGFMSLAQRVMLAPATLLSGSLAKVYFQRASVTIGTPELERTTNRLLLVIAGGATPGFVLFLFWAPDVFAVIFGPAWRDGAQYAVAFSPIAFASLFTSWPERLYEITQRQRLALVLQVVFDAATIALLIALFLAGVSPFVGVLTYASAYAVYHASYLTAIFSVAGFQPVGLLRLAMFIGALGVATAIIIVLIRRIGLSDVWEFGLATTVVGSYYVRWGRKRFMELRSGR